VALEPTDDELLEFVDLLLSNLDRELRSRAVLAEAISERREMWVMLYRVSREFEDGESRP
jgi:uncharacterized membrane protein